LAWSLFLQEINHDKYPKLLRRHDSVALDLKGEIGFMDQRYRWVMLFSVFYIVVTIAFTVQSIPPLIPSIMKDFRISHAQAGLLMSILFVPGLLVTIPAGTLIDHYGARRVGALATSMMALGSFVVAISDSYQIALVGRFIFGVGGMIMITLLPSIVTQWFSLRELGRAMGVYGINLPVATLLAFPLVSVLMFNFGWRYPLYLDAALATLSLVVFVSLIKEGPVKLTYEKRMKAHQAVRNLEIWKAGCIYAFSFATIFTFTTWFPTLFERFKGTDPIYANLLATVVMLAGIICVPIYGWILHRIRHRRIILIANFLSLALMLGIMPYLPDQAVIFAVAIMGTSAFMIVPTTMMLPPQILGQSAAGTGYGILTTCMSLAVATAPPFIGLIIDMTNKLTPSFIGMALFPTVGAIAAYALKVA
jgi:predicted MFS family arabinose efflux permease